MQRDRTASGGHGALGAICRAVLPVEQSRSATQVGDHLHGIRTAHLGPVDVDFGEDLRGEILGIVGMDAGGEKHVGKLFASSRTRVSESAAAATAITRSTPAAFASSSWSS